MGIYLEMAQSTEGTAEERARAFRSYQRLTLTAEEYRKQVAIPLGAAKRKRVDWAKARKIMYASRQSACYDRKRTEEGQFVRRAKKKAKARDLFFYCKNGRERGCVCVESARCRAFKEV